MSDQAVDELQANPFPPLLQRQPTLRLFAFNLHLVEVMDVLPKQAVNSSFLSSLSCSDNQLCCCLSSPFIWCKSWELLPKRAANSLYLSSLSCSDNQLCGSCLQLSDCGGDRQSEPGCGGQGVAPGGGAHPAGACERAVRRHTGRLPSGCAQAANLHDHGRK